MPKISELPAAVFVNATDKFAVVQEGVTKQADASTLLDYIDDHIEGGGGGGGEPGPALPPAPSDYVDLRNVVEPERPGDGYLRLFSMRHGSFGMPHFMLDYDMETNGYPNQPAMLPAFPLPGMHRFSMTPAGSSAPVQFGFPTLGSTGTVTARARWNGSTNTDYHFYYPARVQAVSVTTANNAASLRWTGAGQGMVGGRFFNKAYRGGLYVARFRPIVESDDRVFIGLMDRTTDPTATVNPSDTSFADNIIGLAKDGGDAGYSFICKQAGGSTLKVAISNITRAEMEASLCHLYILILGYDVRFHLSALGSITNANEHFSYRVIDERYVPIDNYDDELYPWFYVNNGSGGNTLSARVEYFGHSITDLASPAEGGKPNFTDLVITSLTYTGKSVSVAAQDTSPRGLRFSSDGLQMYVVGGANATIYQYTLGSPWDVSTAYYSGKSLSVSAQTGANPGGCALSRFGEHLFIASRANAAIYRYDLSTPWDVSTASYSGQSLSTSGQDSSPGCCELLEHNSNLGMRLWVHGETNKSIYQYNLTDPWTLTGASYSSNSLSTSARDSSVTAMIASPSPTAPWFVLIVGSENDRVHQSTSGTPGSLSGASWSAQSPALTAQDTLPVGVATDFFSRTRLYMLGDSTDTVYQYSIP